MILHNVATIIDYDLFISFCNVFVQPILPFRLDGFGIQYFWRSDYDTLLQYIFYAMNFRIDVSLFFLQKC